jgi:signal transduction histidine kinase
VLEKRPIKLGIPDVGLYTNAEIIERYSKQNLKYFVGMDFSGSMAGKAQLNFSHESSKKLVKLLLSDVADEEVDAMNMEVLGEVGNIVINGVKGTIANLVDWNYFLEKWSQIDALDILGLNIFERFPNLNTVKYRSRLESVLAGGPLARFSSLLHKHFLPIHLPEGGLATQSTLVKHFKNNHGNRNWLMIAIQDVTDIHRRSEEIQKIKKDSVEKLKNSNDALQEYARLVSHDLKAPLRGIDLYIELIQEAIQDNNQGQVQDCLDKMSNLTKKMNKLIVDLFTYSQFKNIPLAKRTVNMKQIAEELKEEFEILAKGYTLDIEIAEDLPSITGDFLRMREVLFNLISNAIQHNSNVNRKIKIDYKKNDGRLIYLIDDNGLGIDPDHREDIFKLFYKIGNPDEQSSGAGLAMVKKIIERHHGEIWVQESELGGSQFCFYLIT